MGSREINRIVSVGFDPGFSKFGWAIAVGKRKQGSSANWKIKLKSYDVIQTNPASKKQRGFVRVANIDQLRLDHITVELLKVRTKVEELKDEFDADAVLCGTEWFTTHKSASAAKSLLALGVCHGLFRPVSQYFFAFIPQDVKLRMTGSRSASKDDVISAVEGVFNFQFAAKPKALWEHKADAISIATMNFGEYQHFTNPIIT